MGTSGTSKPYINRSIQYIFIEYYIIIISTLYFTCILHFIVINSECVLDFLFYIKKMRLSTILKFTLLALPTVFLNNVFAYKVSFGSPIDSPYQYGGSLDKLLKAINNSFHSKFKIAALGNRISKSIRNIEKMVESVCDNFEDKENCFTVVERYFNRCKDGECFALRKEQYFNNGDVTIELLNRYELAAALYAFRYSGLYERRFISRKLDKWFRRTEKGYSSYGTVVNAILVSNNDYDSTKSISELFMTQYLNSATAAYATLIYRNRKLAMILNTVDVLNVFLFNVDRNLRRMLKKILNINEDPVEEETFREIMEKYSEFLAGFDESFANLSKRFADTVENVVLEEAFKAKSILGVFLDSIKNTIMGKSSTNNDLPEKVKKVKDNVKEKINTVPNGLKNLKDSVTSKFKDLGSDDDKNPFSEATKKLFGSDSEETKDDDE
ncbi:Rhoptry-associated protein 1 [Babesia duncani]|uniref:Rhoptry-associated protein 1 n=1 Tax=Babesia duncani TaxID=323732 RepID=A0AAD9UNF8_9APIC|nr:Rhoptry-associated protein 1 [Babesia duncani]